MPPRIPVTKRITEFGKELRTLRSGFNLTTAPLGTKLGVCGTYLNARELGKAPVSLTLINKLVTTFTLSVEYRQRLIRAAIRSTPIVRMKLTSAAASQREVAFHLSQQIQTLSEEQCQQILTILKKEE